MNELKKKILVAGATALISSSAFAGDIYWSGFLSVVGGQLLDSSDVQPQFNPATLQFEPTELQTYNTGFLGYSGGEYGTDFTFEQESMIGLQGQAAITDKLRATVQVVARGGNAYNASTEWAYLSYAVNEQFSVNAGRFRLPLYYYSEFLDVGYAYEWIRPTIIVYNGPSAIQGLSGNYSNYFGDFEVTSQFWYGSGRGESIFGDYTSKDNIGINGSINYGDLTVRLVRSNDELNLGGDPIDIAFSSAGIIYNPGNFKLSAEHVGIEFNDGDSRDSSYGSIAYSFGDITPHISYAIQDETPEGGTPESTEKQIGIAWAFHPGAVFKLEYLVVDYEPFSVTRELFGPTYPYADQKRLVTVAIDIVF